MRRAAFSFFLAVLLVGGCEREQPQRPAPPPQPAADTTPRDGGRLTRRLESDIRTLNYILHETEDERQVLACLYEPLIAFDQNLMPVPGVATRWEVGDGGKSYTLHLDPRATWSDGKPVKASDVVFTLGKMLDEQSPQFSAWFEGLDRAQTKAIDDRTVRVVFREPRVAQIYSFNISAVPEHVYGKGELSQIREVVGNGPYVLKQQETGRSVLLERRADYWRKKPHVESVLFRVVADDGVAWSALMRGDLDVGRVNNETWWREKDKPEVRKKLAFFNAWMLSYNAFVWNLEDPLFNDARVRRALAMMFERRAVIDKVYRGQARPVTGPFLPDQWANNDEVVPIEFNPQGASALLASAGWRDTNGDGVLDRDGKKFEFTMLIPTGVVAAVQTQLLQDTLKTIGVKMEITVMDGAAFFSRVLERNFQAAFFAWVLEPDPDRDLYSLFHSAQKAPAGLNVGGYANPEADQLIEQGRVETDRAQRVEIYRRLHELLARDQPYLWTVQPAAKWVVNRRVQNVKVSNGLGLFLWQPGAMEWWIKE